MRYEKHVQKRSHRMGQSNELTLRAMNKVKEKPNKKTIGSRVGRWGYFAYSFSYYLTFGVSAFALGFAQAAFDSYILHLTSLALLLGFTYLFMLLSVKRLHDFGYSGYWSIFFIIPYLLIPGTIEEFIAQLILWLTLLLIPGNSSKNEYGPVPDQIAFKDVWDNPFLVKEEKDISFNEWVVAVVIGGILAGFYFGGLWVGLITFFLGMVALGWEDRHEGPFPTYKN